MSNRRPAQQRKNDRLLSPQASQAERRGDMLLAPFDRKSAEMDHKWGVQRLPELVSVETAEIWGTTLANLNRAQDALFLAEDEGQAIADLKACVESGLRGFDYMDAEATRIGATPADDTVWEIEVEGRRYGLCRDIDAWPRIQKQRPGLRLVSLQEAALAIDFYSQNKTIMAVKDAMPDAKVTAIRPKTPEQILQDDCIPF